VHPPAFPQVVVAHAPAYRMKLPGGETRTLPADGFDAVDAAAPLLFSSVEPPCRLGSCGKVAENGRDLAASAHTCSPECWNSGGECGCYPAKAMWWSSVLRFECGLDPPRVRCARPRKTDDDKGRGCQTLHLTKLAYHFRRPCRCGCFALCCLQPFAGLTSPGDRSHPAAHCDAEEGWSADSTE